MAINSNLTLLEKLNDIQNSIDSMEQILGKGLDQPYNCSNSGARKILYSTQKDHIVPIEGAEPAYNQTGYENRFGDLSSSIIQSYTDLKRTITLYVTNSNEIYVPIRSFVDGLIQNQTDNH